MAVRAQDVMIVKRYHDLDALPNIDKKLHFVKPLLTVNKAKVWR